MEYNDAEYKNQIIDELTERMACYYTRLVDKKLSEEVLRNLVRNAILRSYDEGYYAGKRIGTKIGYERGFKTGLLEAKHDFIRKIEKLVTED